MDTSVSKTGFSPALMEVLDLPRELPKLTHDDYANLMHSLPQRLARDGIAAHLIGNMPVSAEGNAPLEDAVSTLPPEEAHRFTQLRAILLHKETDTAAAAARQPGKIDERYYYFACDRTNAYWLYVEGWRATFMDNLPATYSVKLMKPVDWHTLFTDRYSIQGLVELLLRKLSQYLNDRSVYYETRGKLFKQESEDLAKIVTRLSE